MKHNSKSRTWTFAIGFNLALVAGAIGCGVGAAMTKDDELKRKLIIGAASLYAGSVLEGLLSHQFSLLSNMETQEEAIRKLDSYRVIEPKVSCSINNYHFESKVIIDKKVIKLDKDAADLKSKSKKELEKV